MPAVIETLICLSQNFTWFPLNSAKEHIFTFAALDVELGSSVTTLKKVIGLHFKIYWIEICSKAANQSSQFKSRCFDQFMECSKDFGLQAIIIKGRLTSWTGIPNLIRSAHVDENW